MRGAVRVGAQVREGYVRVAGCALLEPQRGGSTRYVGAQRGGSGMLAITTTGRRKTESDSGVARGSYRTARMLLGIWEWELGI